MIPRRKAVVVGATNGIGKACSHRLANAGFNVIAVGRDKPGRAEALIAELNAQNPSSPEQHQQQHQQQSPQKHEFRPCDAFSLQNVKECAEAIVQDHESIDALVMSQGMATIQSYTETVDGNDEKMTLHYWSRMAFADRLLPSLRKSTMPGGPCVMSILSGGVHSPYKEYATDPYLKQSYSIKNAADAAGYYNDLFMDAMAKRTGNEKIQFIHASPGFVNSNWGTEMPWFLKVPIRGMQRMMAMEPATCAKNMCVPILQSSSSSSSSSMGKSGLFGKEDGQEPHVFILKEDATEGKLTKAHTKEAMETVWNFTAEILGKVGIDINKS